MNSLMGVMNRLNGLYISPAFYMTSEFFGFVSGDLLEYAHSKGVETVGWDIFG